MAESNPHGRRSRHGFSAKYLVTAYLETKCLETACLAAVASFSRNSGGRSIRAAPASGQSAKPRSRDLSRRQIRHRCVPIRPPGCHPRLRHEPCRRSRANCQRTLLGEHRAFSGPFQFFQQPARFLVADKDQQSCGSLRYERAIGGLNGNAAWRFADRFVAAFNQGIGPRARSGERRSATANHSDAGARQFDQRSRPQVQEIATSITTLPGGSELRQRRRRAIRR